MIWAWDLAIPVSNEKKIKPIKNSNIKEHKSKLKKLERLRNKGLI